MTDIRQKAQALLNDIDAMGGCTDDTRQWFGPFPEYNGAFSDEGASVEWPNLAISADKLRAALTADAPDTLAALRECFALLDNSDVRHYISTKLGEQAALHRALNMARKAGA